MRIVYKFGGTSVGTIEKIKNIAQFLVNEKKEGKQIVVVASAMGKTTSELISLASTVTQRVNRRELDSLLSIGEQKTVTLLTMAIQDLGIDAISLTGFQAGFITTHSHTKSRIVDIDTSKIENHLNNGKIVVVAGFQGITEYGDITTLGRGGSDTSAVAIAAKLNSDCHIYTDVEGIYTVDPRVHEKAKKLISISYDEMMELSTLGSKVMETRSVELGKKYGVKIYVGKSLSKERGTYIMDKKVSFEEKPITGISVSENTAIVTLDGVIDGIKKTANIFKIMAKSDVNINMITQNTNKNQTLDVSFSCTEDDLCLVEEAINRNKELFNGISVNINKDLNIISLVGVGMISHFGVAAKVFNVLAENDIDFYQVTTSEISISCAIDKDKTKKAVSLLAREFNL